MATAATENKILAQEIQLDVNVLRGTPDSVFETLAARRVPVWIGLSVLFEIIAGTGMRAGEAAERDFRARQTALRRWREWITPARTIWLTPAEMRCRAFGLDVAPDSSARVGVVEAINVMLQSSGAMEFESTLATLSSRSRAVPSLQFLKAERIRLRQGFPDALRAAFSHLRTVMPKATRSDEQATGDPFRIYLAGAALSGDLDRFALLKLAELVGAWDGDLPATGLFQATLDAEEKIRERYDGSIELYVKAYACYFARTLLQGGDAKVNDSLDLDLFIYLRPGDPAQLLVTDDVKLQQLGEFIAPGRVVGTAGLPLVSKVMA